MANCKSSEKRIQITERNRLENHFYKSSVRTLTKVFLKDLKYLQNFRESKFKLNEERYKELESEDSKIKEKIKKNISSLYSLIDKGTKKNIFHKNTAARKKSQLSKYLRSYFYFYDSIQ